MLCEHEDCVDNLFGECTYTNIILHVGGYEPCKFTEEALSQNDYKEDEEHIILTQEEYFDLLVSAGVINENSELLIEESEGLDG